MRISERKFALVLAVVGLGLPPALAFDGVSSNGGVSPALNIEIAPRGTPTVNAPALAAPGPGLAAPTPALVPSVRTPDPPRKQSPAEAFRTGAQALRAGDTNGGVRALEYAAANGHPIAQWKLGRMYAEGDGVTRDNLRAFEYFRGIADAHAEDSPSAPQARFIANAFVALGSYYLTGIPNTVVKPDTLRAREMFAYAASYFGDPDAQYHLGRLYLDGVGTAKEPKLAARWLGLAANKGHFQAQAVLGAMLFKGDALPRQGALGLMWLTLASDAAPQEAWIKELYDAAFKQASDSERQLALVYIERRLSGRRD
jgi:uncharacterized protein